MTFQPTLLPPGGTFNYLHNVTRIALQCFSTCNVQTVYTIVCSCLNGLNGRTIQSFNIFNRDSSEADRVQSAVLMSLKETVERK